MRLLSFLKNGAPAPGIARDDRVLDLSALDPDMPRDWATLLAEDNLERLRALAEHAPAENWVPRDGLKLALPIPQPPKILCAGLNYMTHAQEVGMDLPKHPILFTRYASSLVADGDPLVRPAASEKYDYESELVRIDGLVFPDASAGDTFEGGTTYTIEEADENGTSIEFRVQGDDETNLIGEPIPTDTLTYEGVVGQFNNFAGPNQNEGYQLIPMRAGDIQTE